VKILVTGANGFIGQHLVYGLKKHGFDVNAMDENIENLKLIRRINIFEGDIFNGELLKKALVEVEAIFHLVAKTHDISGRANNLGDYLKLNLESTRNLLDSCVGLKVKHFIFFSSVKVMSEKSEALLDETCVPNPTTPYGVSKLYAENLVLDVGKNFGFKTTVFRFPLVYGPGNKGNIYRLIEAIDKGKYIMIGKGENKRSMAYVGNCVDAALAVLEKQKTNTEIYIVKDMDDYTVRELYDVIAKELGDKKRSICIPLSLAKYLARAGDIGGYIVRKPFPFNSEILNKLTGSLIFSSRKIQEDIGFKTEYSLYDTMHKTVAWYKKKEFFPYFADV
jgi:UDP-glucose 4-epimerase